MRPQWRPKRHVPDPLRYTFGDHKRVMFRACPRCRGRVIWGDGDTRWWQYVGVRGACLMCPYETYTLDLLKEAENAA